MLELAGVETFYGSIQVIKGIRLRVPENTIVSIVGSNGAGKTTLLRTICGIIKPVRGKIEFLGKEIQGLAPDRIVRAGISMIAEGRELFSDMSVMENLELGGYLKKKADVTKALEKVFSLFPILEKYLSRMAGMLSGGQQQMLAIAMALMVRPKLLLLDEPSLGLAPLVKQEIFNEIVYLNKQEGIDILLVEQNVHMALSISEYGYVLDMGKITIEGNSDFLLGNDSVRKSYLGE
jgi:branched-chain amino acid transport system ATP-binding protein